MDDEFHVRRRRVINAVDAQLSTGSICKEVVIGKKGLFGKIKLGFESLGGNINSIYVRYDSIFRRKSLWTLWENNKGVYNSYEEFKESWNPDTKVWQKIKNELKVSVKKEVNSYFIF